MKNKSLLNHFILLSFFFLHSINTYSQDTFSICAVDSVTGQVGSAGATCIPNASTSAIIISDVHPGVGVIHSQASYIPSNQNYARALMDSGLSPQQIIDSLMANDIQNNPSVRQYGIVDLVNGVNSASYTGANCMNFKNHITGINYSIQGNILLGQHILDSMEARFLNTQGSLACKLMAAMQGAKVIGADTRCTTYGISSYSSFIRVANTNDVAGSFYLDLTVNTFPGTHDPIDSLQVLFDNWGGCNQTFVQSINKKSYAKVYPNPNTNNMTVDFNNTASSIGIFDSNGKQVKEISNNVISPVSLDLSNLEHGMYYLKIIFTNGEMLTSKIIRE
jgi:uncharacterized Ntn-hydrolase superfamily protein